MKEKLEELLKLSQLLEIKKENRLIDSVEYYKSKIRLSKEFKIIAQNKPVNIVSFSPCTQVGITDFVDVLVSSN